MTWERLPSRQAFPCLPQTRIHAMYSTAVFRIKEPPEEASPETAESYLNALRIIRLPTRKQRIVDEIAVTVGRMDDAAALSELLLERVAVDRELLGLSFRK